MRMLTFLSVLALATTGWAQQQTGVDIQAPGVHVQTDANHANANQYDNSHRNMSERRNIRASELIGLNVQNNADETVGEINDIVIDSNSGTVDYVALSAGGFLGIGDTLFAVPWKAFECRQNGDEHTVVLDIDKETLSKAKGFNQENWPDTANQQWRSENDRHFFPMRSSDTREIDSASVR